MYFEDELDFSVFLTLRNLNQLQSDNISTSFLVTFAVYMKTK